MTDVLNGFPKHVSNVTNAPMSVLTLTIRPFLLTEEEYANSPQALKLLMVLAHIKIINSEFKSLPSTVQVVATVLKFAQLKLNLLL